MRKNLITLFYCFIFLSTFGLREALAHKVNIFTYAEADQIYVEGYFADGKEAKKSEITVFDPADKLLLTGLTNEDGQYSFPIPSETDLRIVLNAGMGHQAEYTLKLSEFRPDQASSSEDNPNETGEPGNLADTSGSKTINDAALTRTVERAVAKAIKPLMRSVSEMKESKSLGEIIGGIGFIFGLMGCFFYWKAIKENKNRE